MTPARVADTTKRDAARHVIGGRGAERDAATIAWFRKFGAEK
jgi:hypothetical protein